MTIPTTTTFQRGKAVDFIGSVVAAMSIAVALILDQAVGWGETRWSLLNPDVVRIMLPILAVWIVVAMVERAYGSSSTLLLAVHCVSAIVPTIALAVMAYQGHIFSLWVSNYLEAKTALSENGLETGLVTLAAMMALAACYHAVKTWHHSR